MYNHKEIDKKWQDRWEAEELYTTPTHPTPSTKKYILDMFPYPSGAGLHVGHPEGYTATDILSRFYRMSGFDVLHPMGWDAFGLPAENYAIKTGTPPGKSTADNIKNFRRQIKSIGLSYDWSREVDTSSPDYYKWTQWLFLLFYRNGLAYKKEAYVNWCPKDQTVLANEQVKDGKCDRCGTEVVQKLLSQWFLKITDYAEELLHGLEPLDWPEPIKSMQRNWIGKSEGAEIDFEIASDDAVKPNFVILHGYTGRADKNFIPWLKLSLENNGFDVQAPQLPNTDKPVETEQVEYVLQHCKFDENTVLIGHSLGARVAMRALLNYGKKIKSLVLVAPAVLEPEFRFGNNRPFWSTFSWQDLDYQKLQELSATRIVLSDLAEEERIRFLEHLAPKLNANLIRGYASKEHFTGKQEAMVWNALMPSVKVFTTRPDTLFGATYLVLAPEHPLVAQITTEDQKHAVASYVANTQKKSELERIALEKIKTGEFTGAYAVNPATGQRIPIWIADYVLATYGTGAIMAVPGHDERDFEFAQKYHLPIVNVVDPSNDVVLIDKLKDKLENILRGKEIYSGEGVLVNSGEFNGTPSAAAREKIADKFGKLKIQYKLRDWLVSRQRYWGAPIPIVYCDSCGMQEVPENDLPVLLPTDVDFLPTGESPLKRSPAFGKVKCPKCNQDATRDFDTMDTFVDSSWYFFRFTDPHNPSEFAVKTAMNEWLPVDTYVGGAEHAVLHLLYARFFTKVLNKLGFINFDEPFKQLRNQGLILGPDGEKMSKSRGNVINPDDVLVQYGADAFRMYEMFMGPLEDAKPWSTQGIVGLSRFLDRVSKIKSTAIPNNSDIHKLIKRITHDIHNMKFNTAIAAFMEYLNTHKELSQPDFETFLKLLAPFAPHLTEELWHQLGHSDSIHKQPWPMYDQDLTKDDSVTIVIQVNGKTKGTILVPAGLKGEELKNAVDSSGLYGKLGLKDKKKEKVITVPDKLVNFVIKNE